MKKIRKIDTARRVYELNGRCKSFDPHCSVCFNIGVDGMCKDGIKKIAEAVKASALAYILQYSRKPEEVARLRKENGLKDEVQAIQKKMTTAEPKPVSAKTAPTRDTEEEFWKFVLYGTPYPDHCAGQQSRGYCDDRCPYNDENGLCPYEHETISSMNEYAENFFKKDTRPNFRQALKDEKEFYVKATPELSEELQKVAFECGKTWQNRNTGANYLDCAYLIFKKFNTEDLMFFQEMTEYLPESDTFKEPIQDIEDKADELPEPIKFEDEVPEYVYFLDDDSMIRFKVVELKMKHTKYPSGKEDKEILLYVERDVGNSYIPMVDCYRTLDEAVKIFKSKEVSQ